MSNILAALGYSQMLRIDGEIAHRREMYAKYRERFSGQSGIELQEILAETTLVPWSAPIRLGPRLATPDIVKKLRLKYGIESRNGFISSNQLPYFGGGSLPVAENLSQQVISLPLFAGMTLSEVNYVCDSVLECI